MNSRLVQLKCMWSPQVLTVQNYHKNLQFPQFILRWTRFSPHLSLFVSMATKVDGTRFLHRYMYTFTCIGGNNNKTDNPVICNY